MSACIIKILTGWTFWANLYSFDSEAFFWDLDLSIRNVIVSSNHYDILDDFNFEIVHFLFLDGIVSLSP